MKTKKTKLLLILLLVTVITGLARAADYYIRAGASGDGLNPGTPAGDFDEFQDSYDDAVDNTVYVSEGTYIISASDQIKFSGNSNSRKFTIKAGYSSTNDNWLESERVLRSTIFNGDSQAERSSCVFAPTSGWYRSATTVEGVVFEDFKYNNSDLFINTQRPGFRLLECTVRNCVAGCLFDFTFDNIGGAQPSGFTRCRIYDCTVTQDGGAVYANRGKVFIQNCIFANITGTSGKKGGAIYTKEDMNIWLINNTLYNITGNDGLVWIRPRPDVGSKRDLTVHLVNNLICNTAAASAPQIAVDQTVSDPEGHTWAINIKNNMFDIGATNDPWTDAGTLATLGYTLTQSNNLVSPGDNTNPDFTSTDTSVATAFSIGDLSDAIDGGLDTYGGPSGEAVPTVDINGRPREGTPDIGADENGSYILAYNPSPQDGASDVSPTATTLSWTAGETAVTHHICFGLTNPPDFVTTQSNTFYDVSNLLYNSTYYWRIDEEEADQTIHTGTVWSFRTLGGGSKCELTALTPKLDKGFPRYQPLTIATEVPLPGSSVMQLDQPASSADLTTWKNAIVAADLAYLAYFYVPNSTSPWLDRWQNGPGVTGDEFETMGADGQFPPDDDIGHVEWIYGMLWKNVRRYYVAYRLSGDKYYIDQLLKWAVGMDWVVENKPYLFFPIGPDRDDAIANGVTVNDIPFEPAGGSNFMAHAYSAMLALEYVQDNPGDPNVTA
jgi:hypothetical protein